MRSAAVAVLLLCFTPAISHSQPNKSVRSFFLQTKVKYDYPSATSFYSGWELDSTYSIEVELMHGRPDRQAAGFGIGYQFYREMGNNQQGEIAFIPVYLRAQGTIVNVRHFSLYFGGRIGYNAIYLNGHWRDIYTPQGGLYTGLMLGCIMRDMILLESSISSQTGKLSGGNEVGVLQASLGVGFVFD